MLFLKQFTGFYKMFCCFQQFVKLIIVLLTSSLLFDLIGMVFDSFIDLGRVFTTEFTLAGTLTTLP